MWRCQNRLKASQLFDVNVILDRLTEFFERSNPEVAGTMQEQLAAVGLERADLVNLFAGNLGFGIVLNEGQDEDLPITGQGIVWLTPGEELAENLSMPLAPVWKCKPAMKMLRFAG